MNPDAYRNFLKEKLPLAKDASGGKEIQTRCQYCPDSKDISKGHFYISIPVKEDEPSYFYCQKCQSFGIVTSKKLIEWGIYDPELAMQLNAHNKKIMNSPTNKIYKQDSIYQINYKTIRDDKLTQYKLGYINRRLGLQLSYRDCVEEKIILNLGDLVSENHLSLTRHENIVNCLDNGFVGFLSYDNAFVNMRNLGILKDIPSNIDKRYINYNLFDKLDNTQRFYAIPNQIDLLDPRPIKLHIAEGPFDILSIYHNVRKEKEHNIYAAIGGKRYLGLIKYFVNGMKLVNLEIHLYLDKDIDQWTVDYIKQVMYPFYLNIYIHRNVFPGEKDFGVPIDQIRESIM